MSGKRAKRDASVLQASTAKLPWIEVKEVSGTSGNPPSPTLESGPSGAPAPSRGAELEVGETPAVHAVAVAHRLGRRSV